MVLSFCRCRQGLSHALQAGRTRRLIALLQHWSRESYQFHRLPSEHNAADCRTASPVMCSLPVTKMPWYSTVLLVRSRLWNSNIHSLCCLMNINLLNKQCFYQNGKIFCGVNSYKCSNAVIFNIDTAPQSFCHAFILLPMIRCSKSSSSSSLFVQIKIPDANEEHMIKPEQDSKVEKNHTYCCPWIEKEKNTEFT